MLLENQRILSLHVPKTAGTTLREYYQSLYGPENAYLYLEATDTIIRSDQEGGLSNPALRLFKRALFTTEQGRDLYLQFMNTSRLAKGLKRHFSEPATDLIEIPNEFSIIHGHFKYDKFESIPNAKLVTVVREPLSRTVSEYNYHKWRSSVGFQTPNWFDPKMAFLEFAMLERMQNYQSSLIGNTLDRYVHTGTTCNLNKYVEFFDPDCRVKLTWANIGSSRFSDPELDESTMKKFRQANEQDYELFQRVIEINRL